MKRLIAVFVAAVFVAGTAGFAFAQAPTTPAPKADDKKMDEKKPTTEKKMTSKNASGTLKAASADSVVVAGKDKGKDAEWTFALDAKTKIKKAGKDVTAADLKPGDSVQVRYMEHEGKAVAQTIMVRPAAAAKKDDMKKAAPESAKTDAAKK